VPVLWVGADDMNSRFNGLKQLAWTACSMGFNSWHGPPVLWVGPAVGGLMLFRMSSPGTGDRHGLKNLV
jgi:hypothetical protein